MKYQGGPRDGQEWDGPTTWMYEGTHRTVRVGAYSDAKKLGMYGVYELKGGVLVWKDLPVERKFVGGPRDQRDAAHAYDKTFVRCREGAYHLNGNEFVFKPRKRK